MVEVKVPTGDVVTSDFDIEANRVGLLIGVEPHLVAEVAQWQKYMA